MRSRLLRTGLWMIVAVALVASAVYALQPKPILVDVAVVQRGELSVFIQDDGVTRIRERYVVSSPLTGRLLRISYDVGDFVSASETVLARMQPTDPELLDPRALAQAQARVSAAERRLQATRAELKKAETALNFAEMELGRLQRLRSTAAVSQGEFDVAELAFRSQQEEVRAAGFNVEIAEYELQQQKAALLLTDPDRRASESPLVTAESDAAAEDHGRLETTIGTAREDGSIEVDMELAILAPINGRVLRIYQESAAVVTAGAPIMEIGDPKDLEVVVDVLSRDAVRIQAGAPVVLENWGLAGPLGGRVRHVEPSGFTKTSALGVEEQRVNVIIDLVDPVERRGSLGDNFRVDAKIIVWQQQDVLQIPTSALFRVGQQWMVFRVEEGIAFETPVEVGQNNGLAAQVLTGLSEQDAVIVHPGDSVYGGVKVATR